MRSDHRIHLSILLTTLLGCTSQPASSDDKAPPVADAQQAPKEAPPVEVAAEKAPSIGALDGEFVATISRHKAIDKIELEVAADGNIRELALYHNDAELIPDAVKAKAQEVYPGSTIHSYESELEGPQRRAVFEVELTTAEGQKCEIEATDGGELLYTECEVEVTSLAEELKAAAEKALPDGTIKEVEVVTPSGDAKPQTVVEMTVGETTHKLVFVEGELQRHAIEIKAEIELDVDLP